METLIAEFREIFKEFDAENFPDSAVEFFLQIALNYVDKARFGNIYNNALFLYLAHNLSIYNSGQAAARAGSIGSGGRAIASKSVGSVSITYDNSSDVVSGAGDLNATTYGRQFLQLQKMFGAGCVQV